MLARYLKAQLIVLVCGGLVGPDLSRHLLRVAQPAWFVRRRSGLDRRAEHLLVALGRVADHRRRRRGGALAGQPRRTVVGQDGCPAADRRAGHGADPGLWRRPACGSTNIRWSSWTLRITGPGFDFTDHKRVTVDFSKQAIVTARKLVVLVDPNTRDYEIDWQASALVAGVVPAQITVSEDNKTYDLSGQAGPLMEILQIYKTNNLPFGGTVDIRNYPAVRQQVLAVVRRAAEAQQPAVGRWGGRAAAAVGGRTPRRTAETACQWRDLGCRVRRGAAEDHRRSLSVGGAELAVSARHRRPRRGD